MSETYEEYLLKIPGNARSGFSRSLSREMWNHQQSKLDKLQAENEKLVTTIKTVMHNRCNCGELKDTMTDCDDCYLRTALEEA